MPKSRDGQEGLERLRSYVFQTVETLNAGMKDFGAEGVLEEINRAVNSGDSGETDNSILASHNNIRSLIIKTAGQFFSRLILRLSLDIYFLP